MDSIRHHFTPSGDVSGLNGFLIPSTTWSGGFSAITMIQARRIYKKKHHATQTILKIDFQDTKCRAHVSLCFMMSSSYHRSLSIYQRLLRGLSLRYLLQCFLAIFAGIEGTNNGFDRYISCRIILRRKDYVADMLSSLVWGHFGVIRNEFLDNIIR